MVLQTKANIKISESTDFNTSFHCCFAAVKYFYNYVASRISYGKLLFLNRITIEVVLILHFNFKTIYTNYCLELLFYGLLFSTLLLYKYFPLNIIFLNDAVISISKEEVKLVSFVFF